MTKRLLMGIDVGTTGLKVVVAGEDGTLVGTCGFPRWRREVGVAELAYDLAPAFWGRGVMSAASLPLLQRLGISPVAWLNSMAKGGSMLGSALGGPEARQRWADSRRQKWAADKSGLWE